MRFSNIYTILQNVFRKSHEHLNMNKTQILAQYLNNALSDFVTFGLKIGIKGESITF